MSGVSRVGLRLKPWIVLGSAEIKIRPLFGHVNINLWNQQCNTTRLQRFYTTEHNVVPQFNQSTQENINNTNRSLPVSIANTNLVDISKPVPFNTHQLVRRLQSRGEHDYCQVFT